MLGVMNTYKNDITMTTFASNPCICSTFSPGGYPSFSLSPAPRIIMSMTPLAPHGSVSFPLAGPVLALHVRQATLIAQKV
jgi:hypothetical protein